MTRHPFVSSWVLAASLAASGATAGDVPPGQPRPIAARAEVAAAPRVVSPERVAQLAAVTPRYLPGVSAAKPTEPAPDLRETDKPRNTIIRLPSYLVQEDKPLALKERELMTPQERLNLVLQRHPGLRLGSIGPLRNDGIALFMLAEEERLERMKEMGDLLSLLPTAEQKKVKPSVDRAFIRHELPR